MGFEKDFGRLEDDVKEVENLLHQETLLAQRAGRLSAAVTVSLVVVVLSFVAVNFFNIRNAFTEEKLSRSLEKEMRELSPTAMWQIEELGRDVVPVYAAETRKQLSQMAPEILKRFHQELDQLSGDVLSGVDKRLRDAQAKVLVETEERLFAAIPSLKDPSQREELKKRLKSHVEVAVSKTLGRFNERFAKHVESIEENLLKLESVDPNVSPLDLQKRFIHLWLQLLDQEIMEL